MIIAVILEVIKINQAVGNSQRKWKFVDHNTGKKKWPEKKLKDSLLKNR
jgi:hypothetical protein